MQQSHIINAAVAYNKCSPNSKYNEWVTRRINVCVRGEVQVAAINGTTDAVCNSVIDSPGQQSGVTTNRTENCTTIRAIGYENNV